MELYPGVSKRGLYKEYAYSHGWKITITVKGIIMKTALVVDDKVLQQPQIDICSW